jgi:hypothetical protein
VSNSDTTASAPVTVRMFGILRQEREAAGEPTTLSVRVPAEGVSARALAENLGLPPDAIEGAFVNHVLHALTCEVMPGDRVGFVPYGTPGPHRLYLGLYEAGREGRGGEPQG